jgi:hypothetical protein
MQKQLSAGKMRCRDKTVAAWTGEGARPHMNTALQQALPHMDIAVAS